jgi:hypothetical protein
MKTYLIIEEMPKPEKRKTNWFRVKAIKDDVILGYIQWRNGWREYVFQPLDNMQFSFECLSQIANFIDKKMLERKAVL